MKNLPVHDLTPSTGKDLVHRDTTDDLKQLKDLLGQTLRIKIVDERSFEGQLVCIDKPINIVLDHAIECLAGFPSREVGLIMIPFCHVVRVEASTTNMSKPSTNLLV